MVCAKLFGLVTVTKNRHASSRRDIAREENFLRHRSRVINTRLFGEKTRQRVDAVIERTGFRSPEARGLAASANVVGLLFPTRPPLLGEIIRGIDSELAMVNYALRSPHPPPSQSRALRTHHTNRTRRGRARRPVDPKPT